jgi:multicomponent Na+:H+ antiporter subunit C
MTQAALYALTGVFLFALGLYGLLVQPHLLRKIIAFNVIGSGIFLVFGAIAAPSPTAGADPVPHAIVITGIVVAVSATAFALTLLRRLHRTTGRASLPDDPAPPDAE